jgi:hypothetical protein
MIRSTWMTRLFAAAALAASLGAGSAQAGLLPLSVTVTPEAGNYRWTYAIVLPTDMKLQSGNYFTIYDFQGYLPGGEVAPSADWTFSANKVGPTPDLLNPSDDPDVYNLSWKYTGPDVPTGQVGLGNFWAFSSFGQKASDHFTAETNRTSDSLIDRNITDTDVPLATSTPPEGVPEPATLLMAALGLPLVRRLRKSKA